MHTAVQLFKEKGYDNVTVEEITLLCGIAKGTFFNYFPKKENILLHVGSSYTELLSGIMSRHSEGHPRERLMAIFRDLLHLYVKHSGLLRLVLIESIKSASNSSNLSVFQDSIRGLLDEARESNAFRTTHDLNDCASVLAAIFYQTLISSSPNTQEDEMIAELQRKIRTVWEGIADE